MALWLWVTDLDAKNDWLELKSFSWGVHGGSTGGGGVGRARASFNDFVVSLDPGRFRNRLMNWAIRGELKTVYVFVDPQTEYQFFDALATAFSSSGDIVTLSINFDKMKVEYSGAP